MRAGHLRHRLTLERRVQAPNGTVGIDTSYSAVAVVWGSVEAVRGGVYIAALQVGEGPTHRIQIRYRSLTDFDYITEGARRFRVRDVRDTDGRRQWLDINAEEYTPA